MADGVAFCSACGQAFSSAVALPRAPTMNGPAIAAAAPRVEYGGVLVRFVAYLIYGVGVSLCVVFVLISLIFFTGLGALFSEIHPQEELSDAGIFFFI